MKPYRSLSLHLLLICVICVICGFPSSAAERPNIILIMVDDMGFSDLGYHGSEIHTPNIDSLAHGGVRFSHFYNSGRCCPTRATLMTGLHPHEVGIGHMTQPPGSNRGEGRPPAYQGYLNRNCVTLAEALKPAGYKTFIAGKWHLGNNAEDRWPLQRGFDKFYGCISGATRFFHPIEPRHINKGNEIDTELKSTTDRPYYTTDAFTDHGIRFVNEHLKSGEDNPFFLYLAYTAPHWPLQAHEEDIDRYRETYKIGWDELRKQRYQKQIELGLIDPKWKLSPRAEKVPAWDSLDQEKQKEMALKMAVYAAMIDRVDQKIGDLVTFLKENDLYENTLIMFLTDNGACAEGGTLGRGEFFDIDGRNQESGNSYGEAWANASSTPFRLYKHYNHEGGSATPFFLHWPARIQSKTDWYDSPSQLIDLMPTILDIAEAKYPKKYQGNDILPLDGISMRRAFDHKPLDRKEPLFVEHENNAFVIDGHWKLVGRGVSPAKGVQEDMWELYNLKEDRTELNDLSASRPEKRAELARQWSEWATRAQVFPKENKSAKPKGKDNKKKNPTK